MEYGGAEGGNWGGLSPEVLNMIFQHLPVPDLLSCSVMSKHWKKAARDVLKRSRESYAFIKYFHRDIQHLNDMIASTDIMELINGLHIRNEKMPKEELGRDVSFWQNYRRCSDITEKLESEAAGRILDEAKQKVVAVLDGQWKYLNLDMGQGLQQNVSIDDALLLRAVISASKEIIQKLMVGQQEDWKLIPCCGNEFSNLKVIETLKRQYSSAYAYCNEMSWSTFAPKLKEITGAMMDLDVHDPPDPFMLKRMKSIQVNPDADVPEGESMEAFHCISGLYRLDLQQYHCCKYWDDQDLLSWEAFVSPFVLRSLDTLEDLGMYVVEFYKLCNAYSLIFPNLRRLSLAVHWSTENEVLTLKQLNFAKLCPNLEQMKIIEVVACQKMRGVVTPGVASDELLNPSEMPVVVELECFDGLYCYEYLKTLNKVFPRNRLRKLKFSRFEYDRIRNIFCDLDTLENLDLNVVCSSHGLQELLWRIDALLCGINIEEARLPFFGNQRNTNVVLKSSVVPIRPSLLNANNLKELKINEEFGSFDVKTCESSWVTVITENLPVRHLRNLKVTLKGSEEFLGGLKRLRTFTTLLLPTEVNQN